MPQPLGTHEAPGGPLGFLVQGFGHTQGRPTPVTYYQARPRARARDSQGHASCQWMSPGTIRDTQVFPGDCSVLGPALPPPTPQLSK